MLVSSLFGNLYPRLIAYIYIMKSALFFFFKSFCRSGQEGSVIVGSIGWGGFWRGGHTCQGPTLPSCSVISKPHYVYDYLEMWLRGRFYFISSGMCPSISRVKWTAHCVIMSLHHVPNTQASRCAGADDTWSLPWFCPEDTMRPVWTRTQNP